MTRLLALVVVAAACAPTVAEDRGGGAPYREDGDGAWLADPGPGQPLRTPPPRLSTDTLVWLTARAVLPAMMVDAVANLPPPTTTAPVELGPARTETRHAGPDRFHRLRQCESTNNYGAISPSGAYRGAYQFDQPTWDETARRAGRPGLVGIDPAAASPADQDAMALTLYGYRGAQPWPTCGRHLR